MSAGLGRDSRLLHRRVFCCLPRAAFSRRPALAAPARGGTPRVERPRRAASDFVSRRCLQRARGPSNLRADDSARPLELLSRALRAGPRRYSRRIKCSAPASPAAYSRGVRTVSQPSGGWDERERRRRAGRRRRRMIRKQLVSKNGLCTHFPRRTSTNLEIFFSAYWNAAGAMTLTISCSKNNTISWTKRGGESSGRLQTLLVNLNEQLN